MVRNALVAGLIACGFLAVWLWLPGFATPHNLVGMAADAAPIAIVVFALSLSLRPGEADLSVEGTAALGGMIAVAIGTAAGAALGMGAGMCVGAVTAMAHTRLRWQLWQITLAMLVVVRLAVYALSGGTALVVADPALDMLGNGHWLRVPLPVWIAGAALIGSVAVRRQVDRGYVLRGRLVIVGGMSALAGVIIAVRAGTANPMAALGLALDALCALALAGHFTRERRVSWAGASIGIGAMALGLNVIAVAALPPLLRYAVHAFILGSALGLKLRMDRRTASAARP